MGEVYQSTRQYENNRAEVSHQPTRRREQQMRGFKSSAQLQRFEFIGARRGAEPFSESADLCYGRLPTACFELERSSSGRQWRMPAE